MPSPSKPKPKVQSNPFPNVQQSSVPIYIYQQLSQELEANRGQLHNLQNQNVQLLQENQELKEKLREVVQGAQKMQAQLQQNINAFNFNLVTEPPKDLAIAPPPPHKNTKNSVAPSREVLPSPTFNPQESPHTLDTMARSAGPAPGPSPFQKPSPFVPPASPQTPDFPLGEEASLFQNPTEAPTQLTAPPRQKRRVKKKGGKFKNGPRPGKLNPWWLLVALFGTISLAGIIGFSSIYWLQQRTADQESTGDDLRPLSPQVPSPVEP